MPTGVYERTHRLELPHLTRLFPELAPYDETREPIKEQLSTKKREITLLVSQGLTNNEIAARLRLAPGTVRNHVSVCLQKLCLANRSQLTAWAIKNGLEQNIVREPSDPDTYKDMLFNVYL